MAETGAQTVTIRDTTPPLDKTELAKVIRDHLLVRMEDIVGKRGFVLKDLSDSSISPFATERINIIALTFELIFRLVDVTQPDSAPRNDASVRVKGDCSYKTDAKQLSDVRIDSEDFTWRDAEGKEITNRNVYAYMFGFSGGPRQIPYKAREPIPLH